MYSTTIQQMLIDDAHAELEYRPVVAMMIFNDRDEVLVVQSAKNRNWWGFPQGGIDPGESLEDAAFREAREELGLATWDLDYKMMHDWHDLDYEATRADTRGFTKGRRLFFVSLRCRRDGSLRLDSGEVAASAWVSVTDFPTKVASTRREKRRLMIIELKLCTMS